MRCLDCGLEAEGRGTMAHLCTKELLIQRLQEQLAIYEEVSENVVALMERSDRLMEEADKLKALAFSAVDVICALVVKRGRYVYREDIVSDELQEKLTRFFEGVNCAT